MAAGPAWADSTGAMTPSRAVGWRLVAGWEGSEGGAGSGPARN